MSSRTSLFVVALALVGIVAPVAAQGPGGGARGFGRGPLQNAAEFLLSNSTALELSNDQVVRLAELARTSEARQQEVREQMQGVRPQTRDQQQIDPAVREQMRGMMEQRRTELTSEREQAIAVLSTEQQAQAWELLASARPQRMAGRAGGPRMRNPDQQFRGGQRGGQRGPGAVPAPQQQ
jgi:hypothetical protein